MRRYKTTAVVVLFALFAVLAAGCAATNSSGNVPDDPQSIRNELEEIRSDINNTQEWLKGSKAELQIEDSQDLRNEIRKLEMDLYELRARERALNERLQELGATGNQ